MNKLLREYKNCEQKRCTIENGYFSPSQGVVHVVIMR